MKQCYNQVTNQDMPEAVICGGKGFANSFATRCNVAGNSEATFAQVSPHI